MLRRVVVSTVVVFALAAGCGHTQPTPVAGTAIPVTHQLPDDIVPMLFPATGTDTRWTQGLDRLLQAARYTDLQNCAGSHHVAVPDIPPPMFVRFLDIPDLAFIRAHGFSDSAQASASTAAPADRTPSATQQQCLASAADADKAVRASFAPLQAQWFRALSGIRDRPEVVAAYRDFAACLRQRGLAVSDENDFFTLLESRLHPLDGKPGRAAVEHELAGQYATCMEPVESVREPIRTRLRDGFVAEHAQQVDALRSTLVPRIRELEKRLGTAISFPAV